MGCTVVDWFNCERRVTERFVKMPRTFRHEEYADMVYVYGYCNGNANAAVGESNVKINACYACSKPQAASWFRKRGSHEGVYGN